MSAAQNIFVGELLGSLVFVIGPTIIGFFVARKFDRTRTSERKTRWPIFVGIALSLLFLLGQCSRIAQKIEQDQELIVEIIDGASTSPFPTASEFSRSDLEQYAKGMVENLKANESDPNVPLAAISNAFDGAERTVVRTTFMLDNRPIGRLYVGVVNDKLRIVSCVHRSDTKLTREDELLCRSSARKELGAFDDGVNQ